MACKFIAVLYNPVFRVECIIIVIVLALFFSIMPHLIRVVFFASFFFCDLSHPAMSKAKSLLAEKNRGTNSKRGVQSF